MNRNKAIAAYHLVYVNKYAETSEGIGGLQNKTSVQTFKIQNSALLLCYAIEWNSSTITDDTLEKIQDSDHEKNSWYLSFVFQ